MFMQPKTYWLKTLCLVFALQSSPKAWSASYGTPGQGSLQDNATVCFQLGAWAELTGLDDIELIAIGQDGAAGTIYEGTDSFALESNMPVRVMIEATPLTQGNSRIATNVSIDGVTQFMDTQSDSAHQGEHLLSVRAQLGAISSQLAGAYQSTVTLTVVPQQGSTGGCGEVTLRFPGDSDSNHAVLAFEDLYPSPGDADYNDFVVRYSVDENYNAEGGLDTIEMNFTPIARGAGYNHALKLDLDGIIKNSRTALAETDTPFIGDATVKVTYTNLTNETERVKYFGVDDDVVLFANTRSTLEGYANVFAGTDFTAPKMTTKVEITLSNPELNRLTDEHEIAMDKYRIFLQVMNTSSEIDLANINPDDGMIDQNGYPFGLLVPDDWAWALESNSIDDLYPYFESYRAFLAGETEELSPEAANWFNAPNTELDGLIDLEALEVFLATNPE